jgi:hypothetical protein
VAAGRAIFCHGNAFEKETSRGSSAHVHRVDAGGRGGRNQRDDTLLAQLIGKVGALEDLADLMLDDGSRGRASIGKEGGSNCAAHREGKMW